MDFKVIKKLGNGVMGTVYLCRYNGLLATAKIEKVGSKTSSNGDVMSSKGNYVRQVLFNEFAKKYPNRFLTLLFASVINGCIFKQPRPQDIKDWPTKFRDKWFAEQKSDKCSLLVYAPVLNCTMAKILADVSEPKSDRPAKYAPSVKLSNLLLAIFKYLKKSVDLMNDAGFYHRDLHAGNIMYTDPSVKTTAELDRNIKSLKIAPERFYIIDYGAVYSKAFETNKNDTQHNKFVQDVYGLIWITCENPVYQYMIKNNIKLPDYKKGLRFLEKHNIYSDLVKWLPNYVKREMSIIKEMDFLHMICLFVNYDVYCESINAKQIQQKLNLTGFKPGNALYYLGVIKNLKKPSCFNLAF
jgi:serine/threonine protein kinase